MTSEAGRRVLAAADVHALRWLEDPRPSPDGTRVACVERRVDAALDGVRTRILVVRVADGRVTSPSPDDAHDAAPCWSADGARLHFDAGRAGVLRPMTCDADGADPLPVPGLPEGALGALPLPGGALLLLRRMETAGDPAAPLWEVPASGWRRDGRPDAERTEAGALLVREADGSLRTLLAGTRDRAPRVAPDGATVAILSTRGVREGTGPRSGIWLVPVAGGPARCLVPPAGRIVAHAWSPDGRAVAWLGLRSGAQPARADRLHVTDVATGATRTLALPGVAAAGAAIRSDDPRGMGDTRLVWTADGRIWLRWVSDGRGRLGWTDADGAEPPVAVLAGDGAPLGFDLTPDGALLAYVRAAADTPGDLVVARVADGAALCRVDRNGWLAQVALGPTRPVTARAPDGSVREGWLTLPPVGADPRGGSRPLVVSVHGGPHYAVGPRFSFEAQRLAARGYAVLAGNPRGSAGYGDAHAEAIVGDWGGPDLVDTLALTEAAAAVPGIDPTRVAITGVSYGGWMTLWAIARTDRFRAAIAENPIADLLSAFGAGEDDGAFWADALGGAPWEVPDRYVARSPLVHADAIRTPLLLLHAELDRNCPPSQSTEIFTALRSLGRTVRYLRARDVGHLMNLTGSAAFRAARAAAIDDWLDRFLADDAPAFRHPPQGGT